MFLATYQQFLKSRHLGEINFHYDQNACLSHAQGHLPLRSSLFNYTMFLPEFRGTQSSIYFRLAYFDPLFISFDILVGIERKTLHVALNQLFF